MIPELTPEEWVEDAVKDGFIIKYEFSEFSKIEVVGTGLSAVNGFHTGFFGSKFTDTSKYNISFVSMPGLNSSRLSRLSAVKNLPP
ncbi:11129_t:CDS:2 [Entrophospora sp. SA101]|nr:11129_t:CDS:2 [Entrophospora sp. SA101]